MKNSFFLLLSFLLFVCTGKAQTAYRHKALPSNISGSATILDNPILNGNERAIIFILPIWDPAREHSSCGNYEQNAGVKYDKATQKWAIVNQNPDVDMLPNQEFNVLVIPKETPNCFSVVCEDANRLENRLGMTINHSASNNNPNALLLVTQNYGTTYNNNSQFVFFTKGKWLIANNNYFFPLCETEKSLMPLGAKFNVLVVQKDQVIVTGYPKASAFLHKTTHIPPATNIEYIVQHVSGFISPENSAFNADPNFLIFATPSSGWAQEERPAGAPIGFVATDSPLAAVLSRSNHKWAIVNASTIPFKEGTLINVLAMKSIK